jgi:YesN/AraC family two-component response regulator
MPDLIITDLMMPGNIDGLEFCRKVRQSDVLNHIPIIIITAKTTDADRVKGLEAGADAYLVKPFNSDELLVRVRKLLEQRRMLRKKFSADIVMSKTDKPVSNVSQQSREFLNKFVDVVYANMASGKLDVETIADRMAMSRTQLNRKMLAITGENTSTYIMQLRMSKAKRLLRGDINLPIGNVAQQCGFDDVAYFSRIFKQQCDLTPSQYRKSIE